MAVPAVNIVIDQGVDFATVFKLKRDGSAIDLNGYSFSAKMKKYYTSTTHYDFTVTPSITLTDGVINVGMAKSITSSIPTGRYVYDILITIYGTTVKAIEGNALVKGTVS
jgi:hypothetical protein